MIELSDDKVLFAFAQDVDPVLTIESGETVRIKTQDCFANQIQTPDDELDNIDWDNINPASGPIFVKGAQAGGVLQVDILDIEVGEQASSCTGKDAGVCGELFDKWTTHLSKVEGDFLIWNDKLKIPLNPMIGVIGVAPEGKPVNCGTPGSHGGNMDNTEIRKGTTLYLPISTEGALFGCGDLHAVMADGEISVSGAEIPGYVTAKLSALPDKHLKNPCIETATHFGTIASAKTLDEAAEIAVHDMIELVHKSCGAPKDELVMLFSLVAEVRVCQMVDPEKTVRFMAPKYVLDSYDFSY